MKTKHSFENKWGLYRLFSILLVCLLASCGGSVGAPVATATPGENIPVTGRDTPTALPDSKAVTSEPAQPTAQAAAETPACKAPATLTPSVTEGPYFKAGSPERSSLLENGMPGTTLTLTGFVLTTDCKPVAHALLDFWQADSQGQYDNAGYILRGHQFTDANGHYQLVTVIPGEYPGRTEHIHVKVQAPNGPILTSQLFFPGVPDNSGDGIYNSALLINVQKSSSSEMQASYDFIVNGAQ